MSSRLTGRINQKPKTNRLNCTPSAPRRRKKPTTKSKRRNKSLLYEHIMWNDLHKELVLLFFLHSFSLSLSLRQHLVCAFLSLYRSLFFILARFCSGYLLFPLLTTLTHISLIAASFGLVLIETFMMYIKTFTNRLSLVCSPRREQITYEFTALLLFSISVDGWCTALTRARVRHLHCHTTDSDKAGPNMIG